MERVNIKNEIISYVLKSSDVDNLAIAAFISGMQVKLGLKVARSTANETADNTQANAPSSA